MSVLAQAAAVLATVAALDLALSGELGLLFDLVFITTCLGAAWLAPRRDFFAVAVAPPLGLLAVCIVLAVIAPATIADAEDGVAQATVTGLAHHVVALTVGYAVALTVLGVRRSGAAQREDGQRKRLASPAP